jgi:hypothetical protein
MEETTLVNLVTNLAGPIALIGGLLITGMSLWLNYRSRSSLHREFLYQKQIDVYSELADVMSSTYLACMKALDSTTAQDITPETREKLRTAVRELDGKVSGVRERVLMLLPVDVGLKFLDYTKKMRRIDEARDTSELIAILSDRIHVYTAIRDAAGIDPLTEEMQGIFGKSGSDE